MSLRYVEASGTCWPSPIGQPEDVAAVIVLPASDDVAFVRETCLNVDGDQLDRL